jgi:hypothetical protein
VKTGALEIHPPSKKSLSEIDSTVKSRLSKIRILDEFVGLQDYRLVELAPLPSRKVVKLAAVECGASPEFRAAENRSATEVHTEESRIREEDDAEEPSRTVELRRMKVGLLKKTCASEIDAIRKVCGSEVGDAPECQLTEVGFRKDESSEIQIDVLCRRFR